VEEVQVSQSAAGASDVDATGTASEATDVTTDSGDTTGATTPGGTTESSVTAPAEEAGTDTDTQSRRDRQRAARKQPTPAPAPAQTPEQIIAAYEAKRQADEQSAAVAKAERERYARWTGDTPYDPRSPDGPTVYQQLQQIASQPVPTVSYETNVDEYNAKLAEINGAKARLAELDERRGLRGEVATVERQTARQEALGWVGERFEAGLAEAGIDVEKVLKAGLGQPDPMVAIVKAVASELKAQQAPRVAELEDELAARDSEIDSLRRQLGGNASQAGRGGAAGANGAGTTLQRLIKQAGSEAEYARRAMRGEYAGLDLSQ